MCCLFLPYLSLRQYYSLSVQQENILVDGRGRPVITGFHIGWWRSDQLKCNDGPPNWRAPETRSNPTASDIHAFAVMCWQVSSFYNGTLYCFLQC